MNEITKSEIYVLWLFPPGLRREVPPNTMFHRELFAIGFPRDTEASYTKHDPEHIFLELILFQMAPKDSSKENVRFDIGEPSPVALVLMGRLHSGLPRHSVGD